MALDQITVTRIKEMHPKLRDELLKDYTYVNEKLLGKGVRLRFAYTYRSPEEQTALYNQGRKIKGPKVTNANAYQSLHNYGLAFDIVLLLDTNLDGTFKTASWDTVKDFDKDGTADWIEVVNYFKSKGWTWGGDWRSFPDMPHFEKTFNNTWQSLKSKIDKNQFKTEVVNGKNIKYVNL